MNLASGVWALGVWAPTVWAQCVWYEPGCDVTPPVVTPPTGSSGGGRFLPAPGDYGVCKREISALEKERKFVERRIEKLEKEVDDKQDRLRYLENIRVLNELIASLAKMQEQIAALYVRLQEIEDEEMAMLAFCINHTEWLH